jgi:hypothetical protein
MEKLHNETGVVKVLESFMGERVFRGWNLVGLHYDYTTAAYDVVCTNGTVTVRVKLLDEWVHHMLDSKDRFRHFPIKRALKKAFKIEDRGEEF